MKKTALTQLKQLSSNLATIAATLFTKENLAPAIVGDTDGLGIRGKKYCKADHPCA